MKALLLLSALALIAAPAEAVLYCYSWEDGGTVLASYGNAVDITNVTGPQNGVYGTGSTAPGGSAAFTCPGAYDGVRYLHVAESPHSGTPSVVVAWIKGLQDTDTINGSIYLYDPFDGNQTFPGMRIWGAYTSCTDPSVYVAGAGTNPAGYSGDNPAQWSHNANCVWTWTYNGVTYPNGCFRIEVRLYSTPVTADPQRSDYFIDYICVEVPDHCEVIFPQGVSPVEESTWTTIKALYR